MNIAKEEMMFEGLKDIFNELDNRVKARYSHSFNSMVYGIANNIKEIKASDSDFYFGCLRANIVMFRSLVKKATESAIGIIDGVEAIKMEEDEYYIIYRSVKRGNIITVEK